MRAYFLRQSFPLAGHPVKAKNDCNDLLTLWKNTARGLRWAIEL